MKKCQFCNTENDDNVLLCKYCGSYIKYGKARKLSLWGFLCLIISVIFSNSPAILLLIPALILMLIGIVFLSIDTIKMLKIRKNNNVKIKDLLLKNINNKNAMPDIENLKPFLCSISNRRKKDGDVKRGDCTIAFEDNLFFIIQNNEKIENDIESIYYFDIWEYKDETYFKISMRSHTEYTFKSIHFEADKIGNFLRTKGVKIEDNRE